MRSVKAFIAGAGIAYLFDPQQGKRRRHELADRTLRLLRSAGHWLRQRARFQAGRMRGIAHSVTPSEPRPTDDATVLQRIRSDAFREAGVSTSDVEVTVEGGVATLRGSVPNASLADDLVDEVRKVPGVRDVASHIGVSEPA
jgi:osmotically-inducible protein OsmY